MGSYSRRPHWHHWHRIPNGEVQCCHCGSHHTPPADAVITTTLTPYCGAFRPVEVVDPGTADLPEIEVAFAPPSVEDMEVQYRAWLARQPRDDAAQEARNR